MGELQLEVGFEDIVLDWIEDKEGDDIFEDVAEVTTEDNVEEVDVEDDKLLE